MALQTYRTKRNFNVTSEPRGVKAKTAGSAFVIQKHDATRLHYDLRLELDGVMKSWAVTRGPSLVPSEKRLAVEVEDHPVAYNTFEGTIPEGEYGGGTVMIWDRGRWHPDHDPHKGLAKGHLDFTLEGEKLRGRWHLVRLRGRPGEKRTNWLLIKASDDTARTESDPDILEERPLSVVTGRSIPDIAQGKGRARVWHSNRTAKDNVKAGATRGGDAPSPAAKRAAPSPAAKRATPSHAAKRAASSRAASAKGKSTNTGSAKAKSAKARLSKAKSARAPRRAAGAKKPAAKKTKAKSASKRKAGMPAGAPLPGFLPPSLATLRASAPADPGWVHEIKFDGYRIQARLDRGTVQLLTRKGLDWTAKFPNVAAAVSTLPADTALIDGEIVVQTSDGVSSFSGLQAALKAGSRDGFVYYAFDLLHRDGRDIGALPLVDRKATLKALLDQAEGASIRYSEDFGDDGNVVLRQACKMGLEGIVSKRKDAPYRSGRSETFIKTKCSNAQELVVGGYSPSTAMPKAIGALVAGYYRDGALIYAGRIGTGYTHAVARDLWRRLQPLARDAPAFDEMPREERRRRDVTWVDPTMVIESHFRGWTADGMVRQAAFKGVREDKPAKEVVREMPKPNKDNLEAAEPSRPRAAAAKSSGAAKTFGAGKSSKAAQSRGGAKAAMPAKRAPTSPGRKSATPKAAKPWKDGDVRFTHPDRVYWVDVGVTKQDLADYYRMAWDWMAPHVAGRPLSLVRCPDGTKGQCFFQKHASAGLAETNLRTVIDSNKRQIIAVDDIEGVLSLVQAGVLEIHVRGSMLERLDRCDRIVFDLDPGEGVTFADLVAAARDVRERMSALRLDTFVKLSGGKGLHVVLPIEGVDWDKAKTFSQAVALAMAADSPELYVPKMTKALRTGKIFIDYLRNSLEQTSVAAYSTRARAGAPVSVPVTWQELGRVKSANQYTLLNLGKRLKGLKADPWADMERVRQTLPDARTLRRA